MFVLRRWTPSWSLPSSRARLASNSSTKSLRRLDYAKCGSLACNIQTRKVTWHGLNSTKRWVNVFLLLFFLHKYSASDDCSVVLLSSFDGCYCYFSLECFLKCSFNDSPDPHPAVDKNNCSRRYSVCLFAKREIYDDRALALVDLFAQLAKIRTNVPPPRNEAIWMMSCSNVCVNEILESRKFDECRNYAIFPLLIDNWLFCIIVAPTSCFAIIVAQQDFKSLIKVIFTLFFSSPTWGLRHLECKYLL